MIGPVFTPTDRLNGALGDRYRIERHLGSGGMAIVYLAHDLRHDRKVAIKVLKPELAAVLGAERFVVEIKTTASLQHPHILPLFDSGTADGFLFYVMPYIEGETIREKLNRETQFGVDEAVRIAREVADALDYAHRRGVIHRDIKPENVLLHDGRAMVMDFGIALAVSAAAGGRMTETGLSLGTPHYMSPEQATADKEISGRSDVYSLASVLYEMLAGQPPHLGGSAQQIIMKIIAEPVQPVTALRRSVPPHVASALAKALEKLPADRFESAKAFAEALNTPGFAYGVGSSTFVAPLPTPNTQSSLAARRAVLVACAVAVVATVVAGWSWLKRPPAPQVMRFDLTVGPAPLAGWDVTISPDGTMLVYSGSIGGGSTGIFVRRLAGEAEFRMIAGTETGTHPTFSPDSRWILFVRNRDNTLVRVSVNGGSQTTVLKTQAAFNPHWGTPEQIVYSGPPGIFIVPASGGTPKLLKGLSGRRPFLLPDGSGVLGHVGSADAAMYDLRTDSITVLVPNARHPVYVPTGHLLYGDDQGGISAVRFDLDRHRVIGEAVRVLERVASNVSSRAISVSNSGTLVQNEGRPGVFVPTRLVMFRFDGRADTLPLPRDRWVAPRFSPNGRLVAFARAGSDSNIYTYDLVSRTTTEITFGGDNTGPVWSPDGTRLVFARIDSDGRSLRVKRADNSGTDTVLIAGIRASISPVAWPRDDMIVYRSIAGMYQEVMVLSLKPGAKPVRYHVGADASLSPDARHAAFAALESTMGYQVLIRDFPTAIGQWKVSPHGGLAPRWSRDGRFVYYWKLGVALADLDAVRPRGAVTSYDTLFRVQVVREPSVAVRAPEFVTVQQTAGRSAWDIHPDGKRFIVALQETEGPGSAGGAPATSRHVVVLNWFRELNELTNNRR
jgi:serine/threonine-protein kinase